jgi:hypothetical protein
MDYNTKKEVLTKIWEDKFKDNENTLNSWSKHPKSFVKWGMSKLRNETQTATLKNKKVNKWLPYNIEFTDTLVKNTKKDEIPKQEEVQSLPKAPEGNYRNPEPSPELAEPKLPKRKRRTKEEMLKDKQDGK